MKIKTKLEKEDCLKIMVLICISNLKRPLQTIEFDVVEGSDLIEQISFYLCQPDPYIKIDKRNKYKRKIKEFVNELSKEIKKGYNKKKFIKLRKEYYKIKDIYRNDELKRWFKLRKEFNKKLNEKYIMLK